MPILVKNGYDLHSFEKHNITLYCTPHWEGETGDPRGEARKTIVLCFKLVEIVSPFFFFFLSFLSLKRKLETILHSGSFLYFWEEINVRRRDEEMKRATRKKERKKKKKKKKKKKEVERPEFLDQKSQRDQNMKRRRRICP